MSVGSIVAVPLTAALILSVGWRWMFVLYAMPGVLWAAWFAWWHRETPAEHRSVNAAELELIGPQASAKEALATPWRVLATHPTMWMLCLQQFCRAAGYIFFASWFATYLQEARGMALMKSAWLTTLPLLADVAGGFTGGLISDALLRRTQSRRIARQGMAMTALLLCAALIFTAWMVADPVLAVLVISAGMYCAGVVNPCYSATLMSCGGLHAGTVSAVTNMSGNLGAAAFPVLVPWLIANAGGWNAVLVGFGSLYVLAAAFWLLRQSERNLTQPGMKNGDPARSRR
jgi:ACS family glucarate transporter-like MFS transporter